MVFITLWSIVVYAPLAHWVWGGGFLADMGAWDFAGGTVVHVNAASAALVAVIALGKRQGYPSSSLLPHSVPLVLLGSGLLWFGWFGFNAGSALAASPIAGLAFVTTMLAPAGTLVVWTLLDWFRLGKSTAVGAATAIVVGLVAITPAAGFISPMNGLILGAIAAIPSYFALIIRAKTSLDDSLDVVAAHGVGGTVGALLTGVFADKALNGLFDGAMYGNPGQVGIQAAAVVTAIVYSGGGQLHPAQGHQPGDADSRRGWRREHRPRPDAARRGSVSARRGQPALDVSRVGRGVSPAESRLIEPVAAQCRDRLIRSSGDPAPIRRPLGARAREPPRKGTGVDCRILRRAPDRGALDARGAARIQHRSAGIRRRRDPPRIRSHHPAHRRGHPGAPRTGRPGARAARHVHRRARAHSHRRPRSETDRGPSRHRSHPWLQAPEPNTWRELVAALDERAGEMPLRARRVAVQEYGAPNPELLQALEERGALLTRVPIYQWALPEDLEPLRQGCRALAEGAVDVVLLTTATQVTHLLQIADQLGLADGVRAGLRRAMVASIGPTTSETLREHGVAIDMEPSHPKMGFLVREAAERASQVLAAKRLT